jgi:hypothetical protein
MDARRNISPSSSVIGFGWMTNQEKFADYRDNSAHSGEAGKQMEERGSSHRRGRRVNCEVRKIAKILGQKNQSQCES